MKYKKVFLAIILVIMAIAIAAEIYINWDKGDQSYSDNPGSTNPAVTETPAADNEGVSNNDAPVISEEPVNTEVTFYGSELTENPELEKAIIKEIDFPGKEDAEATRYYYNYVDLNDDGNHEVFVQLVGPYTSDSSGDTGLLFTLSDGGYQLLQKFTSVTNPILISNQTTNGWHDLVMNIIGTGTKPGRIILQYDGKAYPDPSDAPTMKDDVQVGGAAIISDDIASDLENGRGLYLSY